MCGLVTPRPFPTYPHGFPPAVMQPFERAIAHAGRIRLRPILMTAFCTLFGLLPLALGLGAGAKLQQPLALAVIGGLALSTPVTLLAVPGLYAAVKTRRTAATRS
jgi:multidrug efflux pump subunit AcrB